MAAFQSSTRVMTFHGAQPVWLAGQLNRVAGLVFASIVPALFWMAIARGVAHVAGISVTLTALMATGTMIAAFLGYVCAPIMLRSR